METSQTHPKIDLENKVALITGAAQGIGLATAKLLLKHGAKVSIVDISEKLGRAACTELQNEYSKESVMFHLCDVGKREQLKSAFQRTKKKFGNIDIVCNNAGIFKENNWRLTLDINLHAVIEGTYLALEYMSTNNGGKGGTVVNVSSLAGIMPTSSPVYCASKHGVVGFSRSLQGCSTTDGVRVNCICPSVVDTSLVRDNLALVDEKTRRLIIETGYLSPDKVAEGILQLITDTAKSGAVMTATLAKGLKYQRLLGDPPKSKL